MTSHFCPECGSSLAANATCPKCNTVPPTTLSPKSARMALLLCILFGSLGIHRFYVGKKGTGLLMLITFGGLGIWTIIDLVFIVTNDFRDSDGRFLELTHNPSPLKKGLMAVGAIIAEGFVLSMALIAFVFYLTSGLVETVKNQLSALKSGNIVIAYSYTSKDFQKATTLEDFKRFLAAYPSLKYNQSISISTREFENNLGTVKGTLTATDGAQTPVKYDLIKEDGKWKILSIEVMQTGAGIDVKEGGAASNTDESSADTALTNTYSKENRYTIKYPASWEYTTPDNASVVFSGKQGTPYYFSTVNIQVILTVKSGGKYNSATELMASLKKQANEEFANYKLIDEGQVELPTDPKGYHGEYMVFTYTYKNKPIQQMQIVLEGGDNKVLYTWGYTSTEDRYKTDLPIAKSMYESWIIH